MVRKYSTIFSDCLQSSSAHGIGKILKESYFIFKLIWALLFIIAVVFFAVHSSSLIQRWQEMPTSVEITVSSEDFDLPDLYICPTNILSYYNKVESNTTIMKETRQRISESIKAINKTAEERHIVDPQTKMNLFWKSINMSELFLYFGVKPADWIILGITDTRYVDPKFFEAVPDYEYISCLKVSLSHIWKEKKLKSLSMFFYMKSFLRSTENLKHFIIEGINFYNLDFLHFRRTKGILRFHVISKSNTLGTFSSYVTFQGGNQYTLKLSTKKFQRVNRPQNPCIDINGSSIFLKEFYNFLYPKGSFNVLPTSVCESMKMQKEVYENFGCYAKFDYLLKELNNGNWCIANDYLKIDKTEIEKECKRYVPCNTTVYGVHTNIANLPEPEKFKNFVKDLKQMYATENDTYGASKALQVLIEDVENSNDSEMGLIQMKMIKFSLDFDDDQKLLYQEKLSYTSTNLLSDIGGIFGFYMGISVLTLCEVLVLICHLTKSLISRKNEDAIEIDCEKGA